MVKRRFELQEVLSDITANVYFQPPRNVKMKYPCIVYDISAEQSRYADNHRFITHGRYMVTVIDRNPDSEIAKEVADLPFASFNRFYVADNLNHFVYNLYF